MFRTKTTLSILAKHVLDPVKMGRAVGNCIADTDSLLSTIVCIDGDLAPFATGDGIRPNALEIFRARGKV